MSRDTEEWLNLAGGETEEILEEDDIEVSEDGDYLNYLDEEEPEDEYRDLLVGAESYSV